jgi:hypothetical protein
MVLKIKYYQYLLRTLNPAAAMPSLPPRARVTHHPRIFCDSLVFPKHWSPLGVQTFGFPPYLMFRQHAKWLARLSQQIVRRVPNDSFVLHGVLVETLTNGTLVARGRSFGMCPTARSLRSPDRSTRVQWFLLFARWFARTKSGQEKDCTYTLPYRHRECAS